MHGSASAPNPLMSEFAHDPSMTEVVHEFVTELADRVAFIQNAVDQGNSADIRRIAHQLKGAAGGYGFSPISESAGVVEQRLQPVGGSEPDVAQAAQAIDVLVTYCRRAASPITESAPRKP